MHGAQDVRLGGLRHGVLLVIGQDDHVFSCVAKVLVQVCAHVLDVVDASAQLPPLAKVVDPNQQSFAPSGTVAVLKRIVVRCSLAEVMLAGGGGALGLPCT